MCLFAFALCWSQLYTLDGLHAAVVGVNENQAVPPLAEDNRVPPQPHPASPTSQDNSDDNMDVGKRNVTIVVLDGVVIGPMHCAIDDCVNDLSNSHGASLCDVHNEEYGSQCLI
ncbi:uncharacterized protein LACBIDRAFT_322454 [Laccaria bicolor S238N-H82]|uniref:Predicted protein n=1 Tax=Laccaria bicolor (strain S238N-H82 / ATCC MYA-4686) TaxID=486041 RepID=B0CWC2_LACBS|nr:uncharacterized protein LACBIDRAFT_322454 [Laccaria bicolor S238N-H82]EDR13484.1 predicted protein [Laccaria bicolor S238N-H82]|eukprot:XP_001875982.1 predicted protein [Laccaria bicolor S238N-H82]